MVLYPASSLHRVEPVTRGRRVASFFWIQSMARDDSGRRILLDLDSSIRAIERARGQDDPELIRRSDERRVGNECVSTCAQRGSPSHYKTLTISISHIKSITLTHT